MNETISNVIEWADHKSLFEDNSPDAMMGQADKLKEECQEVWDELCKHSDYNKAVVELGDVLVVCTVIATKLGTSPERCLEAAYKKIKERTGKTINGVFVKNK